jgi:Helicase associated domain
MRNLAQIIRELQEAKGRGEIFDPRRLSEKIEVLKPSIELSALRLNIFAEIMDSVGNSWDEMFGRLLLFRDRHEHCRVPQGYKDKKLAKWVHHQRYFARRKLLRQERLQRLRDIGFTFEPYDSQWIARFEDLKVFLSSNGHSNVPSRYKDRELARWVVKQRVAFRNGQLEDWKKERLATVNFELERKELDRRNKQYLTYSKAQSLVWRLGLISLDEYFSWARGTLPKYGGFPENLPRSPQNAYRDNGWTNWNEFLGTSKPPSPK